MLKWLIGRRITAFERAYGCDASDVRDVLEASPGAVLVFYLIMPLAHYRRDLPRDAWFAAKLATTMAEDCGACTQLVVTMAERAGMTAATMRAILARDESAMTPDAALGFRFAEASLARDQQADELREEILRRWGKRALISLVFAIAASRFFPTVRYTFG